MVKLYEVLGDPPDLKLRTPTQIVALLIRCEDEFLFMADGPAGPAPYLHQLETNEPLPPTMASEGLMMVVRRVAAGMGLASDKALSYEILPTEPLSPFRAASIHSVILDVDAAEFDRLQMRHRGSVRISANWIIANVSSNFFFRPISESYRVSAGR